MPREIHVCVNPTGCNAQALLAALQAAAPPGVTIVPSGCIDRCTEGPAVAVYEIGRLGRLFMKGTQHVHVTVDDVPGLLR